jgi:hypothetical protein
VPPNRWSSGRRFFVVAARLGVWSIFRLTDADFAKMLRLKTWT